MADNHEQLKQTILEATAELANVLIRKNHDYGDSFGDTFRELGAVSGLTRFIDKANRLKTLTVQSEQAAVDSETLADTWLDAAGYAILNLINVRAAAKQDEKQGE